VSLGALCLLSPASHAADSAAPGNLSVAWHDTTHPVLHGKPQNDLGALTLTWSGAEPVALEALVFHMDEGLAPLEALALYAVDQEGRPLWNRPLATAAPQAADVRLQAELALQPGENRFRIGCTLHADATLDQRVAVACTQVDLAQGPVALDPAPRSLSHRVGVALRRAGQDGAHTYRIPVLATTSAGTLLCAYDVRRQSSRDLQGDIDVGLSRSLDGGRTWEPLRVIMDMGEWGGLPQAQNGIGDPGLVVDQQTGDIFCFAVWMHGKPGKHQWRGDGSEPGFEIGKTAQFMMVRSQDDGVTWSEPLNLTRQLKAEEWILLAPSPQQGIQLADGTLVMPIQGRDADGAFAALMLSADHGQTWTVSSRAYSGGNECQAAELADGSIMLNIRNGGKKLRAVVTTANRGRDWQLHPTHEQALIEPTCNGSLYRWTSRAGEPADDWLLFVNPRNERRRTHFTLQISTDQGMTWPESQQVLLDEGAGFGYPSVSRVDDEHVGVVYEGSQSHLVFERFSRGELRQACFAEGP
jgi:sialidase-1